MSSLTAILFMGGWLPIFDIFPLKWIPGSIWFALKSMIFVALFVWARAAYPRYRYDQLMRLGWKIFLPLSLGWLLFTAGTLISFNWLPVTNLL
jgi:NADH-quinone oxidoreductase subunit H